MCLPKIGWVSFFHSAHPKGKIKNVAICKKGKQWDASVQTEYEVEEPKHPSSSEVGVDLGICRFATLSSGLFYEPLNSFKRLVLNHISLSYWDCLKAPGVEAVD